MLFGLDPSISAILALDGISSGVIYGLVAIALVLVFAVTRILFLPQGEFVVFGALTLAMLQSGLVPGTVWLLLLLALGATATRLLAHLRRWKRLDRDRGHRREGQRAGRPQGGLRHAPLRR